MIQHLRIAIVLWFLLVAGCTTLPPNPDKLTTYALPEASSGLIAEVAQKLDLGPRETAALPLVDAKEAMDWRLALIDHATTAIDIQYFIWSNDEAGVLLFDRLLEAAERGVRVRLLVDDIGLDGTENNIAVYSQHPNLEIRIYNPGRIRKSALGAIGEFMLFFRELNRRMHNKLFVVDNSFAILGGRNIGNPYFGLSQEYNFNDLDLLLAGSSVKQISSAFDQYWNAEPAYPGAAMHGEASIADYSRLRSEIRKYLEEHSETLSAYPLQVRDWSGERSYLEERLQKGEGIFLQDYPVTYDGREVKLLDMIGLVASESREELLIISPYFIPPQEMLDVLRKDSERGVTVKILTASLGSNNHTAAHSHYKKYRRKIIATGAELYEFRHDPAAQVRAVSDVSPVTADFISLHVKAMVADRNQVFVGSLNLDPRAVVINAENGIYLRSKQLGEKLASQFDEMMSPENAWRVTVDDDDRLVWTSSAGVVYRQPARSSGQRVADFFFRLLPIESQL